MTSIEDLYQPIYREFQMDKPPDRDHTQRVLTRKYIAELLLRGEKTPDQVTKEFALKWEGQLSWLGTERQDQILRDAMQVVNVDLSQWLEKDKNNE